MQHSHTSLRFQRSFKILKLACYICLDSFWSLLSSLQLRSDSSSLGHSKQLFLKFMEFHTLSSWQDQWSFGFPLFATPCTKQERSFSSCHCFTLAARHASQIFFQNLQLLNAFIWPYPQQMIFKWEHLIYPSRSNPNQKLIP
jgi:hypothetical protein